MCIKSPSLENWPWLYHREGREGDAKKILTLLLLRGEAKKRRERKALWRQTQGQAPGRKQRAVSGRNTQFECGLIHCSPTQSLRSLPFRVPHVHWPEAGAPRFPTSHTHLQGNTALMCPNWGRGWEGKRPESWRGPGLGQGDGIKT